jgi:hypothetical protein
VRRQSEAATALWIRPFKNFIQSAGDVGALQIFTRKYGSSAQKPKSPESMTTESGLEANFAAFYEFHFRGPVQP